MIVKLHLTGAIRLLYRLDQIVYIHVFNIPSCKFGEALALV